MKARLATLIAAFLLISTGLTAQNRWAVKTNLLHDLTSSPNLALELSVARHWSIEVSGSINAWPIGHVNIQHAIVQPSLRYWFCDRFNGWFLSAGALGGTVPHLGSFWNLSKLSQSLPDLSQFHLRNGMALGGGIGGGYAFVLGRHWNLELEAALGYVCIQGDEYRGSTFLQRSIFDYVGPTRLGLTFVYLF